jgi:hypothetical protein
MFNGLNLPQNSGTNGFLLLELDKPRLSTGSPCLQCVLVHRYLWFAFQCPRMFLCSTRAQHQEHIFADIGGCPVSSRDVLL